MHCVWHLGHIKTNKLSILLDKHDWYCKALLKYRYVSIPGCDPSALGWLSSIVFAVQRKELNWSFL